MEKQENRNANDKWRPRNTPAPPFLANTISNTSIPRACRIIDALIKAMEPLGCKLTDNLEFAVNGKLFVFLSLSHRIKSITSRQRGKPPTLEYEEKRRKYSYASRPQISKYDYQYNGRLCLKINNQKSFRDCKAYQLEDRLGDMMLELYAAAEDCDSSDLRGKRLNANVRKMRAGRKNAASGIIQRSTALLRWLILLMTMTPLARFAATYQRIK